MTLWWALVGAVFAISLTPGAGAVNTMNNAMAAGWRRAIWGIIGQQFALIVHIVIVAAGVGLLVAQSPVAFAVIRYAGAAYLVFLGAQKIVLSFRPAPVTGAPVVSVVESPGRMLLGGFWVNILNPKSILFFLAFLPQFIRPDQPLLAQYVVLIATVIVVDVIVMWLGFAAAARQFARFAASARGRRILDRTFGAVFIALGAALALV